MLLGSLLVGMGAGPICQTAAGAQCPTAPVQTIQAAVRNCCGKIVGYEQRAPRAGEKGFERCRCAERSAKQMKAGADAPILFLAGLVEIPAPFYIAEIWSAPNYTLTEVSASSPPLRRPPAA